MLHPNFQMKQIDYEIIVLQRVNLKRDMSVEVKP